MNKRWIKPGEAAEYLGISIKTVYNLCAKGILPHSHPPGLSVRIDKKKLDEVYESHEVVPVAEQLRKNGLG